MEQLTIIISIIALAFLTGVIIFIARKMKGSITIALDSYNLVAGTTIKGTLIIKTRKPIQAQQISVGLIGEQRARSYGVNNKKATTYQKVFDNVTPLKNNITLKPGQTTIPFTLEVPTSILKITSTGNKTLDTAVKAAQILTQGSSYTTRYYVQSHITCPGLDLHKKTPVAISDTSQTMTA